MTQLISLGKKYGKIFYDALSKHYKKVLQLIKSGTPVKVILKFLGFK